MPDSCRAGQYNPGGYITPYPLKEVNTNPKAEMCHIFPLGWCGFEVSLLRGCRFRRIVAVEASQKGSFLGLPPINSRVDPNTFVI
jgi:hypothetical protein